MKNYVAQLADNVVEAIIVGDYDWAVANLAGVWHDLGPEPLTVGIGYTYDPDHRHIHTTTNTRGRR
jgi:hypothetical protein